MTEKQDVLKFLKKNGVETRFVSILGKKVYVNNLKLSRFSRKKEELFLANYPHYDVRRSKAVSYTHLDVYKRQGLRG